MPDTAVLTPEQKRQRASAGGHAAAAALTPEQRRLRGQLGAAVSWSRTADRSARTANARRGLYEKFERQVDPDGILAPDERARRAEQAFKAYMLQLSWKASRARSKAARARRGAAQLDAEATAADAELATAQA